MGPSYCAAKFLWLKRHAPEVYAQARAFLQAKDYAVLQLWKRAYLQLEPLFADLAAMVDKRTEIE